MLTVNDLIRNYGDMPLNDEVLKLFGISEPRDTDCMLRIEDIQELTGMKTGSTLIKKIKHRFGLDYDEPIVAASIVAKYFGMDQKQIVNFVKEKVTAANSD